MAPRKTPSAKRPRDTSPVDRHHGRQEEFPAVASRKRPWLLAVSSALIIAWIVFLVLMAFRH